MSQTAQQQKTPFAGKVDEQILVVPTATIFPNGAPQGVMAADFDYYEKLVLREQQFIWRSKAETDPSYKQIVPFLVFRHAGRIFVMQRRAEASEQRLRNLFSIGIGGHIRKEDMGAGGMISWANREFAEEVNFRGSYKVQPFGLINDEVDDVGRVHTGMVYVLEGDSDAISIRDEHKSGELLTLEECQALRPRMERWSWMILDALTGF